MVILSPQFVLGLILVALAGCLYVRFLRPRLRVRP